MYNPNHFGYACLNIPFNLFNFDLFIKSTIFRHRMLTQKHFFEIEKMTINMNMSLMTR